MRWSGHITSRGLVLGIECIKCGDAACRFILTGILSWSYVVVAMHAGGASAIDVTHTAWEQTAGHHADGKAKGSLHADLLSDMDTHPAARSSNGNCN